MGKSIEKVILITGASAGIGQSIARRAGQEGYSVAVNYNRNAEAAQSLCEELRQQGLSAIAVQADVSDEAAVVNMFEAVSSELGPITSLVNNAGIITPLSRLDEMDSERIKKVFDTNVLGCFLCAKYAVKAMSMRYGGKGGNIVNISSIGASLGSPNEFIDYAATKGAVDTLTIGLAKEVAEEGIRVNAVRPGIIETGMHVHTGDPNRPERIKPFIPMKRSGQPSEVAEAVLWLMSEHASYVTGALLDVSGGR